MKLPRRVVIHNKWGNVEMIFFAKMLTFQRETVE